MLDLSDKVVYIYNSNLISECDKLPTMLDRASIVQDLIDSYKLLSNEKLVPVKSMDATEEELKSFHSSSYIDFLKKTNDTEELSVEHENEQLEFGLGYDCPLLEKNYDFVKTVAGGSISAAKLLSAKKCRTCINWFGGWHHAERQGAEGFCYVNDIVIAIQYMCQSFNKILYIDLDIHHGNGVQNAFEFSNKILTLSFHKVLPGFYPGTGLITETGSQKGLYHTINVPLMDGIGHDNYLKLFNDIFPKVVEKFSPDCIVVQCGADGLKGDHVGESNLTLRTYGKCVEKIMGCSVPTLYLGGGGYNFANTARLWTYLTSIIIGCELDEDIPDICENFSEYGPSYELHIEPGFIKDLNTEEYIQGVIEVISNNCDKII